MALDRSLPSLHTADFPDLLSITGEDIGIRKEKIE